MKKATLIIFVVFVLFCLAALYACCVVAGRADRQQERMWNEAEQSQKEKSAERKE